MPKNHATFISGDLLLSGKRKQTKTTVDGRSQREPGRGGKCEKGRQRESKGIARDTQEHSTLLVAAGSNPHSNIGQLQGIPEAK